MYDKVTCPKIHLYRRIVKAKLFIEERYADNIDLNNIAGESFFSKFHFIRQFRKVYHKTPHQYLSFIRVEKAKLFLKDNIELSQVCYAIGFESISSFTGLFKKMTGYTPGKYQTIHVKKNREILLEPFKFIPNCFAEKKGWK